jgi:Fe-S cluster assembly protein SufD
MQRVAQEHAACAAQLPASVVSAERRQRALDELVARGFPATRDEHWRYANLRALERTPFAPAARAAQDEGALAELPLPVAGWARLVIADGMLQHSTHRTHLPPGVTVTSARASIAASAGMVAAQASAAGPVDDRFALLNEAFATDAVEIEAQAAANSIASLELIFVSSGRAAAYPRLRVAVGPGGRLRLFERHLGGGEPALTNGRVEVHVGRDAVLEHFRVQAQTAESTWIETLDASVGENAVYALHQYGLGARSARSTARITLAGPQAAVQLYAASIAEGSQVQDSYARIDHAAPRTRTVENFRGIASGRARVAFSGHIVVRRGSSGADSKQSLRGLLAGPDAEVDARPQLEIYTDDVKCSHGATAGKLDESMLFYLLSRGIDRDTARSLLKWAFLEDTVAHVADAALRSIIEELLAARLRDATVTEGRKL